MPTKGAKKVSKRSFSVSGFTIRLLCAIVLVFVSYNPEQPYSYFYWAINPPQEAFLASFTVLKGFVGLTLVIAWVIFLRATLRSLGMFGMVLAAAFFTLLLWLIVDWGLVEPENTRGWTYLVLFGISGVLAAGLSWSIVRRRLTGQADVDHVDE